MLMLNQRQTYVVLMIGLVAVLMVSAFTRVFAQPTLPPSQIQTEENKVNNAVQSEENKIVAEETHILNGNNLCGNNVAGGLGGDINSLLSGDSGNSVCVASNGRR